MSKGKINIENLIKQVQRNCNVSDAKEDIKKIKSYFLEHLYRDDKKISVEANINKQDFNNWLKHKKKLWKELKNKEYSKIEINNNIFDFSDNIGINEILVKNGFFYHMRDAYIGKPSFLLAKIIDKYKKGKYDVIILGDVLAKDLRRSYYSQCELINNFIFCRIRAERFCLLEIIKKFKNKEMSKTENDILIECLSKSNLKLEQINEDIMDKLLYEEIKVHVAHEFGHAITRDKRIFPNKLFMDITNSFFGSEIEWFVDAIHEVFAETVNDGRLYFLKKEKNIFLLGLYFYETISSYNLHPILKFKMKILFENPKKLKNNILELIETGNWNIIENIRKQSYNKAIRIVGILKEINNINDNKIKEEKLFELSNKYK
jgi:hypothetical protein